MSNAARKPTPAKHYTDFGEYLRDQGVAEEIKRRVEKRVIALQLERRRKECGISKADLARRVGTSRTQIDRILDPTSQNISLLTLNRVATALGKKVQYELVDL